MRIVLPLIAFIVVGCAAVPPTTPSPDPAMVRLAEAADSISQSMVRLAKIESAQSSSSHTAKQYEFNTDALPEVWRRQVVLVEDYYGTVEDFIRIISAMLDIDDPRVVGHRPSNPIMVGLNRGQRPAIEYIADAGFQSGQGVLVRPMVYDKKILLQYR